MGEDASSGPIRNPGSAPNEAGEAVPVVKWKARLPAEPSPSPGEDLEEDLAPTRNWKVKQVPSFGGQDGGIEERGIDEELGSSGQHMVPQGSHRPPNKQIRQENRRVDTGENVVKWKARVPVNDDDDETPSDVPVVKWKAKDVPVVKWKAKVPAEDSQNDDIPVVRRKAKKPEEAAPSSDVPVVKWKAKMPRENQGSDVPVVMRKARVPEEAQTSSPPIGQKTARVPHDDPADVPVVKWKAKMPQNGQNSDTGKKAEEDNIPVVKWKAKMPQEGSEVPVVRKKARMPEENQSPDVPVAKWKAKMPADNQASDVPVSRKAAVPSDSLKPQGQHRSNAHSPKGIRKVARMPAQDLETTAVQSSNKAPEPTLPEPVTPPISPVSSPVHQPQEEETHKSKKPLSRCSSFSESRSPSPPSISPQVRMAIASPVLSRRTPSPSRSSLAGSLGSLSGARQSPSATSPALQPRNLQQYMTGGGLGGQQHSPATSRSFTGGIPSPSPAGSKLRTPRLQSTGLVKTNSPLKGLTPPGERKAKRMLPPSPDTGRSRSRERTNKRTQHMSPPAQR